MPIGAQFQLATDQEFCKSKNEQEIIEEKQKEKKRKGKEKRTQKNEKKAR